MRRQNRPIARSLTVGVCGAIASVSLLAGSRQTPTPQTPVFRAGVDIVQLDVSVFDQDHRPITGLTTSDFTVLEDGKPRPIFGFAAVDIPDPPEPTALWMRDASTDVATNDVRDRRLVMIVMDDASWGGRLHPGPRSSSRLSAPAGNGLRINERAQDVAREVIKHLTSVDLAAIAFTGNNAHAEEFTTDHARLLTAVDRVAPTKMPDGGGHDMAANAAVETLRRAVDYLIAVPGRRKAFIDITAFNADMSTGGPDGERIVPQTLKIFAAAQQANVNVNIMSLRDSDIDPANWEEPWNVRVSHETAGETVAAAASVDMKDVSAGITRIFQANSSYYILGYSSADVQKFHNVKVTVTRVDAEVLARDKYYWPEPEKPDANPPSPIVKAIAGILPNADLPLRVSVVPVALRDGMGGAVAIVLGVRPAPGQRRHAASDDLRIRSAVFTSEGDAKGVTNDNVHVALPPGGSDGGYDALSTVELKPGRYELRISAHSSVQNVDGGVYVTVEMPDFAKLPVSMSGVALSAPSSVPVAPTDAFASLIPVVPTTEREFRRSDRVSAFVRLYEGGKSPIVPAPLHVSIVSDHDARVLDKTESIAVDRFGAGRGADYRLDLPLNTLAPGQYLLTFDTTMGKTAAHREVRFAVR